ncbi:LysR substrate-binding domain-containing protein [Pseudonocardia eucalypti]|uniref:LysR substrate-binding domain-containing protein n=1 Tax=Pseudonocardia eucalypti TaxID=648755 RepID=A0ABP9QAB2_9PSEU|nr:DNA-binding transcriptional LysR family regulator [Pseudonocardia eucalypti]
MDVRTLKYFVLVAEEGSIHGGARRAMVAQPAVSVALKKLERDVGAPLFERSPRGVELTGAGAALLGHARQILRAMEDARREVRGAQAQPAFTVGLVSGRVSAGELTGLILDAFQKSRPDLRLRVRELDFVEQYEAVLDGSVDVAVVRSPYQDERLVMEPLFTEPTLLVASTDHPFSRLAEVPVDAALKERFIDVVRTPRQWRNFWSLADLRNERARSIPSRAVGLIDYSVDVMRNSVVSPMAQSAWRLGGLGAPMLRPVKLVGAPHSVIGVGYRVGHGSDGVDSFASVARSVTRRFIGMVPDGVLATRAGDNAR